MAEHLSKMQRIYDQRVKEEKKLEAKAQKEEVVNHEAKLLEEYKKTDIKNKRFKMRQSGIDVSVNLN